jgi:hypothetical protein
MMSRFQDFAEVKAYNAERLNESLRMQQAREAAAAEAQERKFLLKFKVRRFLFRFVPGFAYRVAL